VIARRPRVNVLISGLLAPAGASAALLLCWLRGEFELVVSNELPGELSRALAYPELKSRVSREHAAEFVELLRRSALLAPTPSAVPETPSRDPGDDYLLALGRATDAILVSWDRDLLDLTDMPIESPPHLLERLDESR
jgi:putative PIN family toxin of toxin-antitoxin system